MIENVPGMNLIITKLLYEKGLEIPLHNQNNALGALSRARSRASMCSSGRASECSLTLNSRGDDGIMSRCKYPHLFYINRLYFSKVYSNIIFLQYRNDLLLLRHQAHQ